MQRGLISQDEADERLADWGLTSYPPGMYDVDDLAHRRRGGVV